MLRETCDKYGVLLIADEVITGFGRTGKMFAMEHWGVVPDIMTVAKGIVSSYLPMAATIATTEVADVFAGSDNFFKHVLTFSGHPAASAAALKNIEIMESENLVENAANVGAYFKEQFEGLKEDHPVIGDVRGIGLMNSLELVSDQETKARFSPDAAVANRLNEKFRKNGLILRADGDHLISIAPPLCVTRSEADEIVNAIDLSLGELEGELGLAK
jgi:adenosylmethionine-8-amino-7-oxononanoate aminotransferase